MRIVDEETRQLVMRNRIDALEADNLFENFNNPDEEADLDAEVSRKKAGRDDNDEFVVEDQEIEESEDISDSNEPKVEQPPADEQVEANLFGATKKGSKSKKQRRDPNQSTAAASARKTRSQIQ